MSSDKLPKEKITLSLSPETMKMLNQIASDKGVSKSEAVESALRIASDIVPVLKVAGEAISEMKGMFSESQKCVRVLADYVVDSKKAPIGR